MRILIFDEDEKQVPQIVDVLKQNGHDVVQVTDWKKLEQQLTEFKPEGIVIDLMVPDPDLPQQECRGGYTTGVYIYKTIIHEIAKEIPFIAYSGVELGINFIREAIEELKTFTEYRGILPKGCDEKSIVEKLLSHS